MYLAPQHCAAYLGPKRVTVLMLTSKVYLSLAVSRRSVTQGAARKTAREKINERLEEPGLTKVHRFQYTDLCWVSLVGVTVL